MWLPPALLLLSLPGSFSIQGPETVKGPERGSVTVQCQYDRGWETYRKWWCRGTRWNTCRILIQTQGTEEEVLGDRVSIRDDQRHRLLSVTMWQLHRNDMDSYWCGIQKTGVDLGFRVQVVIDPEGTIQTESGSWFSRNMDNSRTNQSSKPHIRTHYVLLVFVKVPILLVLVGIVLWLKDPQRDPEEPRGQPISANLSSDPLTKVTAL
ncbi:CMRF35-like molecule 7 [Phacochoerus africanus]|uniref:CMRF35-like molecule 7 n=1 Tax=Phacochoerus africanus TaxID=41426 RepID=UPI001FDAC4AA|nr:CMRF35-like molecule 7 [Phacochoerus africanus]